MAGALRHGQRMLEKLLRVFFSAAISFASRHLLSQCSFLFCITEPVPHAGLGPLLQRVWGKLLRLGGPVRALVALSWNPLSWNPRNLRIVCQLCLGAQRLWREAQASPLAQFERWHVVFRVQGTLPNVWFNVGGIANGILNRLACEQCNLTVGLRLGPWADERKRESSRLWLDTACL